jgi:integrase
MPSLRRRKYKSGNTVWVVDYRENGRGKSQVLGDVDKLTATRMFHELCAKLLTPDGQWETRPAMRLTPDEMERIRAVESQAANVSSRRRIPDLEREYMAYSRTNKAENTCEIIQVAFWKFREFVDDIPLEDVTFQLIEGFKAWSLKKVNGTTTNISLRALKAGFEFAVRLGWLGKNPFKGIRQVHVPEPDYAVYLDADEVKQLLGVIPDVEFRRLIRFYLLTGCRRTEAVLIDWRDINLEKGTIIVRSTHTKTKKNRVLQIGDKLHDLLLEQGPQKQGKVFPRWQAGSVTAMFRVFARACNFGRKITVHSLRHTATVHFLMAGIDMFTVSRILGHTSVKVTETVYAHIPIEHKREAMDTLPF